MREKGDVSTRIKGAESGEAERRGSEEAETRAENGGKGRETWKMNATTRNMNERIHTRRREQKG